MRHPPVVGQWLLTHVADEALVGDVTEEYRAGRSACWYWREVTLTLVIRWFTTIRQHRVQALWATALAWTFMTCWGVVGTNVWREWHQNDDVTMVTRWVGYFVSGVIVGRFFRVSLVVYVILPLVAGALLRHFDLIVPWIPRPMQPPEWRAVEAACCLVLGAMLAGTRTISQARDGGIKGSCSPPNRYLSSWHEGRQ
jgi:hypothetical protein